MTKKWKWVDNYVHNVYEFMHMALSTITDTSS